jgi:hypothetical protein
MGDQVQLIALTTHMELPDWLAIKPAGGIIAALSVNRR